MEIIKHGNKTFQVECEECGCIFVGSNKDLKYKEICVSNSMAIGEFTIECPECNELYIIKNNKPYRYTGLRMDVKEV